jgi:hypothetical protein
MPIFLGNTEITSIYHGSSQIAEVYKGSTKLWPSGGGGSGIQLVSSGNYESINSGSGGYSTSAIDTTGANLLVFVWSSYDGAENFTSSYFSDSKGNTWTFLPITDTGTFFAGIAYSAGSPTVGSGHTMDFSGGFSNFSSAALLAFFGAASSPFDTNTQSDASETPGSIAPAESNELFVTGVSHGSGTPTLGGDFTQVLQVPFSGGSAAAAGVAYYISDNDNAVNPVWSVGSGSVMAAFKAA